MPISLVGSTTQDPTVAVTTLSSGMPAGVATGDLVLFVVLTNTTTIPAAPSGYTQIATGANSTIGLGVWYKFATNSSEPAPSTTQSAFRATSATLVYRGVDSTTPIDVAAGTSTTGTTAVSVPARTPLTAGAWDIAIGSMLTSATNTTTWSSTNLVLDQPSISNVAGSNNPAFVVGHFAWTSGAFTPNITKSATSTRTLGTHFVLRPAASSANTGTSASTLPVLASAAIAAVVLAGSATAALPPLSSQSAGDVTNAASSSSTLPPLTSSASGTVSGTGAVSSALPSLASSALGLSRTAGPSASTLPSLLTSGAGLARTAGTTTITLPSLTSAATGAGSTPTTTGTSASTLPSLTSSAQATSRNMATSTVALPALTAAGNGTSSTAGQGAGSLPSLMTEAVGGAAATGSIAATLPALATTAIGNESDPPPTATIVVKVGAPIPSRVAAAQAEPHPLLVGQPAVAFAAGPQSQPSYRRNDAALRR